MKAILLLGGFGTRLRPLTNDTPKQMLPVCGRPMIEWVCEHLWRHGVDEVVLSLGYRAEAFTAAYPQGRIGQLAFQVAVEPEPRGTAGAVRFAAEASNITGNFLVLNGDVLTDLDMGALVSLHMGSEAEATIALQPVADPSPYGLVVTDPSGRVLSFSEKPEPGSAPAALPDRRQPTISAGTYVLTSRVLDRIAPDRPVSIEREVFPQIVADGTLAASGFGYLLARHGHAAAVLGCEPGHSRGPARWRQGGGRHRCGVGRTSIPRRRYARRSSAAAARSDPVPSCSDRSWGTAAVSPMVPL